MPMQNSGPSNFRSPAALARFLVPAVVGLTLDLWTKYLAEAHLRIDDTFASRTVEFIPGWLHFQFTKNYGAVFGLGQGMQFLFLTVSVVAIAFLGYLFATSGRQRFYQIVLGMLMAGVLGNMYDRLMYGYVRDMIHIFPGWPAPLRWWPAEELFPWIFNIADSLLCVGVALLLLHALFVAPSQERESAAAEENVKRET